MAVKDLPLSPGVDSSELAPPASAPTVLSRTQKLGILLGILGLGAAVYAAPVLTLVLVNGALVLFFVVANAMKLALVNRSLKNPSTVTVDLHKVKRISDEDWPIYTILLRVYREASVLGQLVAGIQALDNPEHRLDVKLLLEEDDFETRDAAAEMQLPEYFDVLVIPDVGPAKLNYFNRTHNLLTRWFTSEYSVWFDQLLPGLQSLDVAIPLGGTSNHFYTRRLREIGGWNAFNVTEDADLGLRIFLRGWKTAILDSTTYEEATSRCRNWIRQRSRWVKGYMQTYLYHMRRPAWLARRMGPKAFTSFQLFFGAGTLCLILNPLYWLMAVVWFACHLFVIQLAFPRPILYLGTVGLFVGNAACVLSVVSGAFGRRHYEDVKWALLVPFYWLLMSVAAWKALIQLFYKPSYWEKTEHGFCKYDDDLSLPHLAPVHVRSAS